ncbi:hypothetical protein [Leptolyngbya sp. FACHB-261]|uniref:hypothetical protein n=1 Tax=Leptolyngbya sp. FACHB-261 TaxID=2692806 RepID=UPI0018EFD474|nr:hypothetical protein [Leptolyngbya sp. FACHB-261]
MVSSGEFIGKPVALLNASPHASHAQASLTETLTVMMANIIPEASLTVPLLSNKISKADIIANPAIAKVLHAAILAFVHTIDVSQAEAESH